MRYEVTTLNVCAQGFERLRSESEFILCAYVWAEDDADSYLSQWLDDIQSCMRPEGFDYDAAEKTVRDYWRDNVKPLWTPRGRMDGSNPFALESKPEDDDNAESCVAFLYVNDNKETEQ